MSNAAFTRWMVAPVSGMITTGQRGLVYNTGGIAQATCEAITAALTDVRLQTTEGDIDALRLAAVGGRK